MSDEPAELDRDRLRAETLKLLSETGKLIAEQRKLISEERKLISEERKLDRDRWLAPLVIVNTLLAAAIGGVIVAALNHVWH